MRLLRIHVKSLVSFCVSTCPGLRDPSNGETRFRDLSGPGGSLRA